MQVWVLLLLLLLLSTLTQVPIGFSLSVHGFKTNLFVLMIQNREQRQVPIAVGLFDKESIENYDKFFEMCHTNIDISVLLNRPENAIIHDRHLSFDKPIAKWFSKALNKCDLVHLVRNCAQYIPGKKI